MALGVRGGGHGQCGSSTMVLGYCSDTRTSKSYVFSSLSATTTYFPHNCPLSSVPLATYRPSTALHTSASVPTMNGTGNHSQLGSDFGPPQDSIQPASLQVDTSQPQSRGKRKLKPYVRNAGGITEAEMVEYDTHLNRGDNRPQLIEDDPDYGKNPGKAKRRRVAGGQYTSSLIANDPLE